MSYDYEALSDCVIEGDDERAAKLTQKAIDAGADPVEIITEGLTGGMSVVGARFKTGEMFVPEARTPFVAVPISQTPAFGSGTAGVASTSAVAGFDSTARAALGAPVPGPLVVNAAPISAAAGLSILGGALLAMILIGGAAVLMTSGRSRPQAEYGSSGTVSALRQRQSEKPAETDQDSRRKAA